MNDLDEVRALVGTNDITNALALIERIEARRGYSPRLAVLKARCLQLSEGASLEDVETALKTALSMDDEYVDAHLEMGWFRLMVLDDAEGAKPFFTKATDLLATLNSEAVRGMLACDEELHTDLSPEDAKAKYQAALIRAS